MTEFVRVKRRVAGAIQALWLVSVLGAASPLLAAQAPSKGPSGAPAVLQHFGLFVGCSGYVGKPSLTPLRFAAEDVGRVARTTARVVPPSRTEVLVPLQSPVADSLRRVGYDSVTAPTSINLERAFGRLKERLQAIAPPRGLAPAQVLVFISAHGEAGGVYLEDGLFSAAQLQQALESLRAESVLLVADACFSADWWTAKGGTPGEEPPPEAFSDSEIARAVRDLERVGAVSANSYTLEDSTVVRGGLLAHVFLSAWQGDADLNFDGVVTFEELETYVEGYSLRDSRVKRIEVVAPRLSPERPPVLIRLSQLGSSGLLFPASSLTPTMCYWVRDAQGQMVAELCQGRGETRRLYLPPGRYQVQRFEMRSRTGELLAGREGVIGVTSGLTTVEGLTSPLVVQGKKGEASDVAPGGEAAGRVLDAEEEAWLNKTPYKQVVDWRALPGRDQWALLAGVSVPQSGVGCDRGDAESLTQEGGFAELELRGDRRLRQLERGYLSVGGGLRLGVSPGNVVGTLEDAVVYRGLGLARVGLELPRKLGTWHAGLEGGVGVGWGRQGQPSRDTVLVLAPAIHVGLELAEAWLMGGGRRLEVLGGVGWDEELVEVGVTEETKGYGGFAGRLVVGVGW